MSEQSPPDPPFGDEQLKPEPRAESTRPPDVEYVKLSPESEGFDFSYYARVLYMRRWSVATAFVLAIVIALLRNYTTVPVYEARARVLVEPERLNLVSIQDPVSNQRSLEAELAILQSRWLAKKTVHALDLVGPAEPATNAASVPPRPPAAAETWWTWLVSIVSTGLESVSLPPLPADADTWWATLTSMMSKALGTEAPDSIAIPPSADETPAEARQIDAFLGGLQVSFKAPGLLDVTYRSVSAGLAAKFANAHTQEYIAQNLELRFSAVKEVTDWLAARIGEQRQKVDASEEAVSRFREEYGFATLPGTETPAVAGLNEVLGALTTARAGRLEKEAVYNRALASRSDPAALERLPQIAGDATIQRLRLELDQLERTRAQMAETLLDRHPEMIKVRNAIQTTQVRLDAERSRVIESMRESVAAAQRAEAVLAAELEAVESEASVQNLKGLELNILVREAESNRQIYDMLVQRARDTSIAQEINPRRIRILDAALVPGAPVEPNKRRNLLLALVAGLAFALALAIGFEYLDNHLKSPDQIRARLGLPFLGLVPELRRKSLPAGTQPLISNGVAPQFVEAIRRLRTNVLFTLPDESCRSVVFTSTGPEEGKTLIASNLAVGLALAGQRVLLLDADMHRPAVHTLLGVPREPGLSNLLVGNAKASDVVQSTTVPNLWVLPSGRRPPNPSELLGSQHFKTLLHALGDRFDWVLIDAPPVMAVTDACVLGHVVSGVLFVVGAEMVSVHAARRSLEQLEDVDSRIIGVVLSRADLDRHAYYYAPYYDRKYGQYYESVASS